MQKYASINHVLDSADSIDWSEGIVAYARYNEMMLRFADYYHFSLDCVAAAFVSLSPNNDYMGNLRSLASVLQGINDKLPLEYIKISTYNHCRDRAYAYATGHKRFLDCTFGPKIRSFYFNILEPHLWGPVTIDGHMMSIWLGQRITMKEAVRYKLSYEDIAHAVREIAFMRCMFPHQVQAICWFAWKRTHNILADDQLHLFRGDDQNGTLRDVARIKPYRRYNAI